MCSLMGDVDMARARWTQWSLIGVALLLASCASRPMGVEGDPGFFLGLWHGLVAPLAFVVSLFSDEVRMYAFPNVGRLYDLGFILRLHSDPPQFLCIVPPFPEIHPGALQGNNCMDE